MTSYSAMHALLKVINTSDFMRQGFFLYLLRKLDNAYLMKRSAD
jgi:hypothetical protein